MIIAEPYSASPVGEASRGTAAEVSINAKSGTGVIPTGETEVTIENKYVANNNQIILMPISDNQNQVLFLKAKKASSNTTPGVSNREASPDGTSEASLISGWFKVGIDKPIGNNLEFKWWLID